MASPTTWGPTSTYSPTASPFLNGVLSGSKWGGGPLGQGTVVTYSFPQEGSFWSTDPATGYGPTNGNGEPWDQNFAGSTPGEQAVIRSALGAWGAVANISFAEVADNRSVVGDMRFGWSTVPTAHAYYPAQSASAGDVWFGRQLDGLGAVGSYAFATVLHEIGHAIGLKHPHDVERGFGALPVAWDAMEFSIMSYRSYVGASAGGGYRNETFGFAQSPMVYDIQAVQHMYGANFGTNSGSTVYQWNANTGQAFVDGIGQGVPGANRVFETIWDGGGVDTYDFSNYGTNLSVSLGPGGWSLLSNAQRASLGDGQVARANVFNAFQYRGDPRSLIENATGGSGSDAISGNVAANVLNGNGGADVLNGLAGGDTLLGGVGRDAFVFTTALDRLANVDRISDFSHVDDVVRLEDAIFTRIGSAGVLAAGALADWRAPDQADDRILYLHVDSADPDAVRDRIDLYYDPTGGSSADAILFAQLTNQARVTLDFGDFAIV